MIEPKREQETAESWDLGEWLQSCGFPELTDVQKAANLEHNLWRLETESKETDPKP